MNLFELAKIVLDEVPRFFASLPPGKGVHPEHLFLSWNAHCLPSFFFFLCSEICIRWHVCVYRSTEMGRKDHRLGTSLGTLVWVIVCQRHVSLEMMWCLALTAKKFSLKESWTLLVWKEIKSRNYFSKIINLRLSLLRAVKMNCCTL